MHERIWQIVTKERTQDVRNKLGFLMAGCVVILALALAGCGNRGGSTGTPAAGTTAPMGTAAAPTLPPAGETTISQPGTAAPIGSPVATIPAPAPAATVPAPAPGGAAPGGAAPAAGGTSLDIGAKGEQLLFDKNTLGPVPAGAQVSVKFNNTSTINQHNWILLKVSDDAAASALANAGAATGPAANYLPQDMANVVAHTALLNPGASETVTFTAPAPGTYMYICTVPGHYVAGMKGTLTVQ